MERGRLLNDVHERTVETVRAFAPLGGMKSPASPLALLLCLCGLLLVSCRESGPARRPLEVEWGGRWNGFGVSFSPYRDGQSPETATYPGVEEIRADLDVVRPYWRLLRTYDSTVVAERTLELIRRDKLPYRVLLGVWVAPERDEKVRAANRREVENGIRLANAYPDIVSAVIVGNETCVFWSFHYLGPDKLLPFVREVRAAVKQPVTVADDHLFWNKTESQALAAEVDFITLHYYALWRGRQLDEGISALEAAHDEVVALHPGVPVIIGETGWATTYEPSLTQPGGEGEKMRGEVSLAAQKRYVGELQQWSQRRRVPVILFEAFDENWKGGGPGSPPTVAEKHWGVFDTQRRPKPAVGALEVIPPGR